MNNPAKNTARTWLTLFLLCAASACGGGGGSPGTVGGGAGTVAPTVPVSAALAVLPGAATANVGDVLSFQITGGAPGYTVNINNAGIATVFPATVPASGGTFTATLINAGSTLISIVDSSGAATSITLTVNQSSTLLRLSPSALLVGENDQTPITLYVHGGSAPYTARTSDLRMSGVSIAGTAASSSLIVAVGSNGSRCINPVDAENKYVRSGTYPVTITVVDSVGAFATSIMTIQDNGAGLGVGCP